MTDYNISELLPIPNLIKTDTFPLAKEFPVMSEKKLNQSSEGDCDLPRKTK